ncbi:MAG: hypothetical protein NTY38_21185 [Acidobacteria bacterium]|nr:hypothetical protein [Acidobacteriota bacterium]
MTVSVKFTIPELELLTSLAADQMFRKEFIDPKMPGYKSVSGEISLGKALVARLRLLLDRSSGKEKVPARPAARGLQHTSTGGSAKESDAV